ncbi:MAG TPA: endonuclease III [Chloroflexota bacterium]|nr:endonuclease III [Chloroflexota bacterium]
MLRASRARKKPAALKLPRESAAARRQRTTQIIRQLRQAYPEAKCALEHQNPFQLLVATILSAQATDKGVNKVTPELFRRYPTPHNLAVASPDDVRELIKPTGFFNNKTKSIQGAARKLDLDFDGRVPDTMPELLTLPGVARKTANVVLGTAFGKNEGVVVDTHVARIASRLGLTKESDPTKIEQDLMALVPRDEWTIFGHTVIFHGRQCCYAIKPQCARCPVNELCPSAFKV